MPASLTITGNGLWSLGDTGPDLMGIVVFQVAGIAGASLTPKRAFLGTSFTPSNAAYRNELSQADVAIGTPITADGIYSVRGGVTEVLLDVSGFATPITISFVPLYGWRRRTTAVPLPDGNENLIGDFGGTSEVGAFYDVRAGITIATGVSQWNDCRGASGFGPPLLQATAANQPARTGTGDSDYEVSFDGTNDFLKSAAFAGFDNSGAATLIYIGTVPSGADGRYAVAIQDTASFIRVLAVRRLSATAIQGAAKGLINLQTTPVVAPSTTRRLVIVAQNATTGCSLEVPDTTAGTGTGSDQASGDNVMVVGAITAGSAPLAVKVRAIIRLQHEITAGEVTALKTWSSTYHSHVAA